MASSAEERYQQRVQRLLDVTELRVPDQVPFVPQDAAFFSYYTGVTWEEATYDVNKYIAALLKMYSDFDFDAYYPPFILTPGTWNDAMGFRQLKWAGAKDPDSRMRENTMYQFVEPGSLGREGMPAEDYDWFLDDPTDYMLRRQWPRMFKALEPFRELPPIHSIISYYAGIPQLMPAFGSPEIRSAFETLLDSGAELAEYNASFGTLFEGLTEKGYPPIALAICIAPHEYFSDFLRGATGCMIDMYRNPEKLKLAIDRVTPWVIEWGLAQARTVSHICKRVFIPIHKGQRGFMSDQQYREFFWPSLRRVIMALIDEGFTPVVETQGIYTDRLEIIRDVPQGKVIYMIEEDIFEAKKVLGDTACVVGGPPASMMEFGSPEEVKEYCRKLIDVVGKDGGFIMSTQIPLMSVKPENLMAIKAAISEYGVY